MAVDKRSVLSDLHAMMHARLFNCPHWLPDREACNALNRKLDELGLREHISGDERTTRNTALGVELNLDLIMVFMGFWEPWEMPAILLQHGLIDEVDEARIYDLLDSDASPELVLRPVVRRAFRDHFNPTALLA